MIGLDKATELFHRAGVQLADALFGDPKLVTNLFQGEGGGIFFKTRPHRNNLSFAGIEMPKELTNGFGIVPATG